MTRKKKNKTKGRKANSRKQKVSLDNLIAADEFNYFFDSLGYIETSRMQDESSVREQAMSGQIPFYKAERIISELNAYRDYQLSELRKSMPHIGLIRFAGYSGRMEMQAPEIDALDEGGWYSSRTQFPYY